MILRDVIRTLPSGAPIAPGTEVRIYRERDNALLGTVVTDANGMFQYETPGNPGTVRYEANVGAGSKIHSTRSILPVADLDLSGVRPLLSTFLDGVVVNYRDALEVVSDGLSMKVTVGAGVAVARGVIYRQETTEEIAIPAAVGNPRIDVIAIRFWLDESGNDAGRCELVHKQGTAAVTPVAPALEQTASIWETPLAEVRVDPSVIGIAQGKVRDTRLVSIPFIPDGTITKEQLADNVTFGINKVFVNNVDQGTVNRLHFLSPALAGTYWSVEGQLDLYLDFAGFGTTFKPAHSDHWHSAAIKNFARVGATTVGGNVSGQTAQSIAIPAAEARGFFRVRLRAEGGLGTTANGSLYLTVNGVKQESFGYQCDQGVDSTIEAVAAITLPASSTTTVSWGIDVSSGSLTVKDGHIEWDIQPNR